MWIGVFVEKGERNGFWRWKASSPFLAMSCPKGLYGPASYRVSQIVLVGVFVEKGREEMGFSVGKQAVLF